MQIVMMGAGYVGLVTGACLADFGHSVTCVEKDADKLASLSKGHVPIYEPGLQELMATNVAAGRLGFEPSGARCIGEADAVFLAVGTPSRRGDGHADLSFLYAAAAEVAPLLRSDAVLVVKSTVPVGTCDEVARVVSEARGGSAIPVVSNPEFLREGAAIRDFKFPDRIVIGTQEGAGWDVMERVYRPLNLNQPPLFHVDRRSAEIIKYASNCFLATKVAFINEMADFCEAVGGNVQAVARGMGLDGRIGTKFLNPGPGFGGSCFPKDLAALLHTARDNDVSLRIAESVASANSQRKRAMGRRVVRALGDDARGKTVAVLGLAFKSNTDDMRDAPSVDVIAALTDAHVNVVAYDPAAMDQARAVMGHVRFAADAYSCCKDADAVVFLTEWDAFRGLDLRQIRDEMKGDILVDLRNIVSRPDALRHGFTYVGVGVKNT